MSAGISYLHAHNIVHTDLRGVSLTLFFSCTKLTFLQANILIGEGDTPQIMDVGLSLIVSQADFTSTSRCGQCRWMPPEILDVSDHQEYNMFDSEDSDMVRFDPFPNEVLHFTKASDIYSLGMTILEVLTGKVPFHHCGHNGAVLDHVIHGRRPPRPIGIASDGLWELLGSCWETLPARRPTAKCAELWLDLLRWSDEIHSLHSL